MTPSVYHIAFSLIKGMSIETAVDILNAIGSEERFFSMSEKELTAVAQLSSKVFSRSYRDGILEKARRESEYISKNNIRAIYYTDNDFPFRLKSVADAPLLVYAVGDCNLNASKAVSIVGTRHATAYGIRVCRELVLSLKEELGDDLLIVSGLAYGIDITAHKAALEVGLPTVAVMAHGLDMIYPAQHRSIAVDIAKRNGCILTEYMSRTRIHRSNFLARNRIIAALSDCTVVVESALKGGALVTANIASSYSRDVFAFPGRVGDEYSAGCIRLIYKNVATVISGSDDLIDAMRWEKIPHVAIEPELFVELNAEEKMIYDFMSDKDFVNIGELCGHLKIPVHKILGMLMELEYKGIIQTMPGNQYHILRKI